MFTATEATSNGLADQIASIDDAIAIFAADMCNQEDNDMTMKDTSAVDQAALKNSHAYHQGLGDGKIQGHAIGTTAERRRLADIMNSDEGRRQPEAALRMDTGDKFAPLGAEAIVELLSVMQSAPSESRAERAISASVISHRSNVYRLPEARNSGGKEIQFGSRTDRELAAAEMAESNTGSANSWDGIWNG